MLTKSMMDKKINGSGMQAEEALLQLREQLSEYSTDCSISERLEKLVVSKYHAPVLLREMFSDSCYGSAAVVMKRKDGTYMSLEGDLI